MQFAVQINNTTSGYDGSGYGSWKESFKNETSTTPATSVTTANTIAFLLSTFPTIGRRSGKESEEDLSSLGFGIPNTPVASKIVHYCLGTLLALIGLAGILGNGLVLFVFTRYRRLRGGGGGPLILSLACGDFLVSAFHALPAYSSFQQSWSFGTIGCELYAGVVGLGGLASLLTLAVIAADRFSVILGVPMTWLSTKKTCCGVWLLCLLWILPPYFGWSRYVIEGLGTSCTWDYTTRTLSNRLYYIFLLLFGFFFPVAVIIFSYVGILRIVCKQSSQMNGVHRNGVVSKKGPTKSDLKTAQVIFSIIICFLVSWTPYAFVSLLGQFGPPDLFSPLATALPAVFAKASVIYNPFVYGLSHPHFRSAVKTLRQRKINSNKKTEVSNSSKQRYKASRSRSQQQRMTTTEANGSENNSRSKNERSGISRESSKGERMGMKCLRSNCSHDGCSEQKSRHEDSRDSGSKKHCELVVKFDRRSRPRTRRLMKRTLEVPDISIEEDYTTNDKEARVVDARSIDSVYESCEDGLPFLSVEIGERV